MFGLKSVYFYLIACQIILIKFFKKIYFSSKNYNKSLRSKTPKQIYYSPNPFLLSVIAKSHGRIFKISDIDPNIFWLENKKKNTEQMHNFFWLNLLDRKADHKKLKRIIYIWMVKNSKYRRKVWETSTLSARIISWILNTDIILNNSTFYFWGLIFSEYFYEGKDKNKIVFITNNFINQKVYDSSWRKF